MPPEPPNPPRRHLAFLRSLERYTKTDMVYLASGGFWLLIDEIGGGLAALLLAITFAHFVPKDVYGTYRFLTAAYWTLTAFTMTGLGTAVTRAITQGYEGAYRASFFYSIRYALPLSFIALGTGAYYFANGNSELGYGFMLIALLGPLLQAGYLWGAYFTGRRLFRELSLYGLLFSFVPLLAIFLVTQWWPTPTLLLLTYLGGTALVGLALAWYIFAKYHPNTRIDTEHRNLGAHFSAMNLLSTVASQIDKLVVFHYLGAVELAVYSFATALPEQIKNVFGGITTLALPKFVARPFAEIQANFWGRLWIFTGVLVLATLVYIVLAPFAFKILFPSYPDAIWYSQLYALSLIPIGGALPVTLLQAHKAKRELYILNSVGPILQISALVILTSLYGLAGTIIARIIGRVASTALSSILVLTYTRRTLSSEQVSG